MASDLRNKRLEKLCLENMNLENKSELFCNHVREEGKYVISPKTFQPLRSHIEKAFKKLHCFSLN